MSEANDAGFISQEDKLRYRSRCDIDEDMDVDMSDLALFSYEWLWIACWKESQMVRLSSATMEMMMPGESMAMAMPMPADSLTEPTAEEQIANIEDILIFLDNLWINDKDMRKTIHKKQWEDFIATVESSLYDIKSGL